MVAICGMNYGQGWAQSQPPSLTTPSFEVASIKVNTSGARPWSIVPIKGGRLTATNVAIKVLLGMAYGVQTSQIVGTPAWVNSERYDISARAEGNPTFREIIPMLKTLLEDRFKLRAHRDIVELSIYALVVSKGGPKIHPSADGSCPQQSAPDDVCGSFRFSGRGLTGKKVTMLMLARALADITDRYVIDKTGLAGQYDVDLEYTPESIILDPTSPPNSGGPPIFLALQEQLALRLESTKGPVPTLVLDHIAKPSDN